MKNITEFIYESKLSTDFIYYKFPYAIDTVDDLKAQDYNKLQTKGVVVEGNNPYTFYAFTTEGANEILRFMLEYEQTNDKNEILNDAQGLKEAISGRGEKMYCVLNNVDIDERFTPAQHKMFENQGVIIVEALSEYAEFGATFFVETKEAFDNVLMPWLLKYTDEADAEGVCDVFPELKPYI